MHSTIPPPISWKLEMNAILTNHTLFVKALQNGYALSSTAYKKCKEVVFALPFLSNICHHIVRDILAR